MVRWHYRLNGHKLEQTPGMALQRTGNDLATKNNTTQSFQTMGGAGQEMQFEKRTVNTIVKTPIFFVLQSTICNTYKSLMPPPSSCLWIIIGMGGVGAGPSAIAIKWSVKVVLVSIKGGERRVLGKNSLGTDMSISKSQRGLKLQTLSNGIPV